MKLVKEDKKTLIEGKIESSEIVEYLSKLIDYYIAIFAPQDTWLTKRERMFLICCIIIANKDLRYLSGESKHIYKEIFNISRMSDIAGYLERLKEKHFLDYNKKTKKIQIQPFFLLDLEQNDLEINIHFKFNS